MTFQSVPRLLLAICVFAAFSALGQSEPSSQCKDISVEAKTISQSNGYFTVRLEFPKSLDYGDFTMNLFAENRNDNKLVFSSREITNLPKGNYLLVIQSKRDSQYCTKQLQLKLR